MAGDVFGPGFEAIVKTAIGDEVSRIVNEECEAAASRVRERMALIAPQVVMSVFKEFDVARSEERLIITVRHPARSGTS